MNIVMICWDMDGTLADLYGVPNWLEALRSGDPTPYETAEPMFDMEALNMLVEMLMAKGVQSRVVTWLSKGATPEYKDAVRQAKEMWLVDHCFPYNHFHGVRYGATKADSVRKYLPEGAQAVLIDDNEKVRNGWTLGPALDPHKDDIISFLADLLNEREGE